MKREKWGDSKERRRKEGEDDGEKATTMRGVVVARSSQVTIRG